VPGRGDRVRGIGGLACVRATQLRSLESLALLAVLAWFAVALFAGRLVGLSERALAGAEAPTPIVIVVASRRRKGMEDLPDRRPHDSRAH
jgi:hypothetical protein